MNKQLFKLALLFLFGFSIVSISSCNKDEDADPQYSPIVGLWTISEYFASISGGEVDIIEYLSTNYGFSNEEAQAAIDGYISNMEILEDDDGNIEFKADNSYHCNNTTTNETEDGTWLLSTDEKNLNLKSGNEEDTLPILDLTSASLILGLPVEETIEFDEDEDGVPETIYTVNLELRLIK